jgi:crotonobetainyl-CoA:carnitine CoA-transferase CaiB-like acyl-CoA transferase
MGPLSHLTVIECGEGIAAAFAGRLLADLGADVIKVESPQGDITRLRGPFRGDLADAENSGLFVYLNAGKRGITLDLHNAGDRDNLQSLLGRADVLLHNVPPYKRGRLGLDCATLCRIFPELIVATVSAYGGSGPRANYRAYELNAFHASGAAAVNPFDSPYPELAPLKVFGSLAEFEGALNLALVTLAAIWHRLATGCGQAVDVSEQEALAATLEFNFVFYSYAGIESSRFGSRRSGPWFIAKCKDGYVLFSFVYENHWTRFVEWIGHPQWTRDPDFANLTSRGINSHKLRPLIQEWVRTWKVRDLFSHARAHKIPIVPLSTMAGVYHDEQLAARKFFIPLPARDSQNEPLPVPGYPFKSTADIWSPRGAAPRLGEHNGLLASLPDNAAAQGNRGDERPQVGVGIGSKLSQPAPPLAGVRVLDFMQLWVGTFCSLQLAHLGAEVIRVESSLRPCQQRGLPPFADGKPGVNRAGVFNQWNQGKRSIQVDVRRPEGLEIARRLIRHCDVVTENFAVGAMERMGLGYENLRAIREDIILLSISGNGQTGPYATDISYGTTVGALSGIYGLCGYEGFEPMEPRWICAESVAALTGAFAVVAALVHRARTGQGQHIDLSMLETTEMVLAEGLLEFAMNGREPRRLGNHDRWMTPHNCYKAKGGPLDWVTITLGSEHEWRSFCSAIGTRSLAEDPRFCSAQARKSNEGELDAIITDWTRRRDRWEITAILQAAGVAAIPTMNSKDLAQDEHLLQRGFFPDIEHPEVGHRLHTGIPWTMTGTPCKVKRAAPLFGADTDEILSSLLNLSEGEIRRLRNSGALK